MAKGDLRFDRKSKKWVASDRPVPHRERLEDKHKREVGDAMVFGYIMGFGTGSLFVLILYYIGAHLA